MKASTVFVTIQLFDVLRIPVAQMPNGLSQIASTFVGLRRIQGFLKRDEVKVAKGDTFDTTAIADTSEPCIEIKDGLFGWKVTTQTSANEKPPPTISNMKNTELATIREARVLGS